MISLVGLRNCGSDLYRQQVDFSAFERGPFPLACDNILEVWKIYEFRTIDRILFKMCKSSEERKHFVPLFVCGFCL